MLACLGSTAAADTAQRPVEVSENIFQNLFHNLTPQTVQCTPAAKGRVCFSAVNILNIHPIFRDEHLRPRPISTAQGKRDSKETLALVNIGLALALLESIVLLAHAGMAWLGCLLASLGQ